MKKWELVMKLHQRANGRRGVGGEHGKQQPVLPDGLRQGADVGYQRARGPEPVVVALERVEHAAQRVPVASVGTWPPQGDLAPMLARRMRAAWNHDRMKSGAVSQPAFDRASSAAAKCASWSACALPNAGRAVTRAT